jgi:hypothetical protein
MKKRSPDNPARRRHHREKATIDHLVDQGVRAKTRSQRFERFNDRRGPLDRRAGPQGVGSEERRPAGFLGRLRLRKIAAPRNRGDRLRLPQPNRQLGCWLSVTSENGYG